MIFIVTCQCSVQNGSTMLKTISSKLCPLHGDSCSLFKSLNYIISIVRTTFEYPCIFKKIFFDWSHLICQWIFIFFQGSSYNGCPFTMLAMVIAQCRSALTSILHGFKSNGSWLCGCLHVLWLGGASVSGFCSHSEA